MSQYNLTDNVNESFKFTIGEHEYEMRYPLVEEIEKLQELVDNNKEAIEKGDKEVTDELQEYMYSFISPVKDSSPKIGELLKKKNVRVLQNFNTMVKAELGISQ